MVTQLGKVLRIIRINVGDSMKDMATKLDVSISYLSAIENGKRNVPENFENMIKEKYPLSEKDLVTLRDAIADTASKVKVNITDLSDNRKKLLFALTKGDLDEDTIDELCAIVDKKGGFSY